MGTLGRIPVTVRGVGLAFAHDPLADIGHACELAALRDDEARFCRADEADREA
jgi:hypothetical protein